jgi:hypothetical protein
MAKMENAGVRTVAESKEIAPSDDRSHSTATLFSISTQMLSARFNQRLAPGGIVPFSMIQLTKLRREF